MRGPCPAVAEHRAGEPAGLVALQPDDFGSGVQFDIEKCSNPIDEIAGHLQWITGTSLTFCFYFGVLGALRACELGGVLAPTPAPHQSQRGCYRRSRP